MDAEEKQIKAIIFPYLKAMSYHICKTKPKELVFFMIDFLRKECGYTASGLTVDEKRELEQLRNEVKIYRQLENHKNTENELQREASDDDEDDILTEEEQDTVKEIESQSQSYKAPSINQKRNHRSSVSAEVYGIHNKKEMYKPKIIPKSQEQIARIKSKILSSFIFSSLEKKDLEIIIKAMEEKRFIKGENVITQGQDGNCLYIVETGELDCFKSFPINKSQSQSQSQSNSVSKNPSMLSFKINSEAKYLKTYSSGDSFGELALLYNTPRAATVRAKTDSILWALDRVTFNHIVKEASQKKRDKYEKFLKEVDILSTIEPYELMAICDAIKTGTYHKGDYIIKEKEIGDVFYILEEGECVALKEIEAGKPLKEIQRYKKGGYFGERALISGDPRYANVVAVSDLVKVISLDRYSFKRLLGPIQDLLKRNMEKYKIYCAEEEEKTTEKPKKLDDIIKEEDEVDGEEKNEKIEDEKNDNNNNSNSNTLLQEIIQSEKNVQLKQEEKPITEEQPKNEVELPKQDTQPKEEEQTKKENSDEQEENKKNEEYPKTEEEEQQQQNNTEFPQIDPEELMIKLREYTPKEEMINGKYLLFEEKIVSFEQKEPTTQGSPENTTGIPPIPPVPVPTFTPSEEEKPSTTPLVFSESAFPPSKEPEQTTPNVTSSQSQNPSIPPVPPIPIPVVVPIETKTPQIPPVPTPTVPQVVSESNNPSVPPVPVPLAQ